MPLDGADQPPQPVRLTAGVRVALIALVVSRGIVLLCILPPLEGWDEYQHVAYLAHLLETGRPPLLPDARVSPALLREVVKFPHGSRALDQLRASGALGHAEFWARSAPPAFDEAAAPIRLYQAQHAPLYYRAVAPLFAAAGGIEHLARSVAVLRLVNVGLLAAATGIILGRIARWWPARRDAVLLGLLIASQPLLLVNAARVANDALGMLLATVVVVWSFELHPDRWLRRAGAVGIVAGLAVLAKATNLALIPFVLFCIAATASRRGVRTGRAALAAAAFLAAALVVTQTWWRENWSRHGVVAPMQETVLTPADAGGAAGLLHAAEAIDWLRFLRRIWLRDTFWVGGWTFVSLPAAIRRADECVLALSLAGWLWIALRRRAPADSRAATAAFLCACYTAALAYHAVRSQVAWGGVYTAAWYLAPALAWLLLLACDGAAAWPRIGGLLPAALLASFWLTSGIGVLDRMVRTYAAAPPGGLALRRLASLQPAFLQSSVLVAALGGTVILLATVLVLSGRARSSQLPR